ncbi:MAG: hypothetical protein L6R40_003543 [Gallowayella cf. fulva]|nr:MAG: hypothetical protein L6R40_003543 [Xanthomendoza cf. fulva]
MSVSLAKIIFCPYLIVEQVRSGNIVASYAISPTTTFTCPPCSIKLSKGSSREETQTITYCSVADPRPKILCFLDQSRNGVNHSAQLKKTIFDLPENGVPIVHIDTLVTPHSSPDMTSLDVLCIHQDGQVSCYDEALTQKKWGPRLATARDSNNTSRGLHVVQASSVSIPQARKTILKNREDILGLLDANIGTFAGTLLLLLTRPVQDSQTSKQRRLMLRILAAKIPRFTGSGSSQLEDNRVEEIMSLRIPEPEHSRGQQGLFSIHNSSGSLYQGTSEYLSIYDLTTFTPRLVQTMRLEDSHNSALSYVRIAPGIIATVLESSVGVVDTRFTSLRAKYDLTGPKTNPYKAASDRPAKSPTSLPRCLQLLTYHGPSQTAIVLFGRNLMAVDLSVSLEPRSLSRKRKRNGLLIDAIGRGSLSTDIKQAPPERISAPSVALGDFGGSSGVSTEWEQQEAALNALLEKGDHLGFDRMVSSIFKVADQQYNDGTIAIYPLEHQVDGILSTMFSTDRDTWTDQRKIYMQVELRLKAFHEQAWRHLVQRGLVTTHRLEASLRRRGLMNANDVLKEGSLIKALADWDMSLDSLVFLLRSPCLIQISEICQALKITIGRFATLGAPSGLKTVDDGDEPISPRTDPVDQMDLVSAGPTNQSRPSSSNGDVLHILFDTIIARCDACPAPTMTKALKTHLSKTELQKLVILLRTKLRLDGWLSPYTEETIDLERPHNDREISVIGKLLNCVVDALGTGGWLLNNNARDDGVEAVEIVSNMQAEISTALEGIWEANYLQGLLGELLLCGKGALAPRTVRAQPRLEWRDSSKSALPLGLQLAHNISLTKVGAGGELQKRSRRDIGKLKSRRVPEYSFERIAI